MIQELAVDELERNRRRRLMIRTRDSEAACVALTHAGFSANMTNNSTIAVADAAAIERPDDVAICLVNAGHAPTMLNVEQEDLEHYFCILSA